MLVRADRRLLALAVLLGGLGAPACGGSDVAPAIAPRFVFDSDAPLAGPAVGADDRIVIAKAAAPGAIETVEAVNGVDIEGPFETLPTDHAPVMVDANLYLVARVSGRVVGLDLAGQEVTTVPDVNLGNTGPLVAGADGRLRIASNAGALHILPLDGSAAVQADLGGVAQGAPAVDDSGVAFVATDLGRVVGVDATGAVVFDQMVTGPASGPAVSADRVAVGALDGVVVFDRAGAEVFRADRGARVVGTRILADGDVLAWGEDGRLERYDAAGAVVFSASFGPPVYAEVQALDNAHFAVVDDAGTAYLVSPEGEILDQRALAEKETGSPARQTAHVGSVFYATRGARMVALDFDFRP